MEQVPTGHGVVPATAVPVFCDGVASLSRRTYTFDKYQSVGNPASQSLGRHIVFEESLSLRTETVASPYPFPVLRVLRDRYSSTDVKSRDSAVAVLGSPLPSTRVPAPACLPTPVRRTATRSRCGDALGGPDGGVARGFPDQMCPLSHVLQQLLCTLVRPGTPDR